MCPMVAKNFLSRPSAGGVGMIGSDVTCLFFASSCAPCFAWCVAMVICSHFVFRGACWLGQSRALGGALVDRAQVLVGRLLVAWLFLRCSLLMGTGKGKAKTPPSGGASGSQPPVKGGVGKGKAQAGARKKKRALGNNLKAKNTTALTSGGTDRGAVRRRPRLAIACRGWFELGPAHARRGCSRISRIPATGSTS